MLNRHTFFRTVRTPLFGGRLRPGQVQGLSAILDTWERDYAHHDIRFLAYMLATAHHETDHTMQPIREYGSKAYLTRMYDVVGARPALARRMGNARHGDGIRYCGRGYVQLTWKTNYRRAGLALGIDLVAAPDRAMEPAIAARIMGQGMIEGWFTGRKLADYFHGDVAQWRNARRIINGLDKAELIRGYALAYSMAIREASAPVQRRAASAAGKPPSSAKAKSPKARNSTPVAANTGTAATSGA